MVRSPRQYGTGHNRIGKDRIRRPDRKVQDMKSVDWTGLDRKEKDRTWQEENRTRGGQDMIGLYVL